MTEIAQTTESKDLVLIETIKPEDVFKAPADGEMSAIEVLLTNLETGVRGMAATLDIKTKKGRNEIKSLAYKVATSKTGLDELGKSYVADLKKAAAVVDAGRRAIRERLDALRDEVRKPVDDYEADVARCVAALDHLRALASFVGTATIGQIDEMLNEIDPYRVGYGWGDYQEAADELIEEAHKHLTARRAIEVKAQADREELEQLRREKAEREEAERKAAEEAETRRQEEIAAREREALEERRRQAQQEREERIAREAAETARRDAEMRAAAEAAAAEEKAAAATRAAERAAAEAAAEAARRAENQRQEEKRAAAEARRKADEEIAAANARAERAAEDARQRAETERRLAEAEAKRIADEAAARERDDKNRFRVFTEIAADVQDHAWLGELMARDVATAITSGHIRNVKVEY